MANVTEKDLMYAILSMDAYNRGNNAAVEYSGQQIGNAIAANDQEYLPDGSQSAGFYAVAYQWNGETII